MRVIAAKLGVANRLEESLVVSRRLLELNPDYAGVHAAMGMTLMFLRRNDEALVAIERKSDGDSKIDSLPLVYWAMGRRSEADAAFAWLNRGYRQRAYALSSVKVNPLYRNLHPDPRFQALLVKLGLAD